MGKTVKGFHVEELVSSRLMMNAASGRRITPSVAASVVEELNDKNVSAPSVVLAQHWLNMSGPQRLTRAISLVCIIMTDQPDIMLDQPKKLLSTDEQRLLAELRHHAVSSATISDLHNALCVEDRYELARILHGPMVELR